VKVLLGIDRAIAFTLLARGWSAFATLITVGLIAKYLSPAEQGYYYSFASLVALQVVFELGFSFVILQMASHERAHVSINEDCFVSGDPIAHSRLASILQKAVRWYAIASILLFSALIPLGFTFFISHANNQQQVNWRLPWECAVLATTLTFIIDPFFSFLEGCGYVQQIARTRLVQSIIGAFLAWTALRTHHGLFAPALMILGQATGGALFLWTKRKLLLGFLLHDVGVDHIHWGSEVWSFQWRIAVSWLCGFFMFQLFNPILFAYWGPIAAGQMGMSLTICNGLTTAAFAWVSTKSAPFGMMIARKEYRKLDATFFRALGQAVALVVCGSMLVWVCTFFVNKQHLQISHRLVSPATIALLLGAMVMNTISFSEALYLRVHKQEKFMAVSVASAILIACLAYFLGRPFGAFGMALGYFLVSSIVGVGFGTTIFLKYRKQWHMMDQIAGA
jgi:O-antigen/teichoic acid export membrane protein